MLLQNRIYLLIILIYVLTKYKNMLIILGLIIKMDWNEFCMCKKNTKITPSLAFLMSGTVASLCRKSYMSSLMWDNVFPLMSGTETTLCRSFTWTV